MPKRDFRIIVHSETGLIERMEWPGHTAKVERDGADAVIRCSCKDSADQTPKWRVRGNGNREWQETEIMATYNAHLSYFDRKRTGPD